FLTEAEVLGQADEKMAARNGRLRVASCCRSATPAVILPLVEVYHLAVLLVWSPLHQLRYLCRGRAALAVGNGEREDVVASGEALQLHLAPRLKLPIPIRSPG